MDRPCADPPNSVLCYDESNARILIYDIDVLMTWVMEAQARCGEKAQ